jgi:MFS family permease
MSHRFEAAPNTLVAKRRAVLGICAVAQFMVVLDVSIVNVALPQMRHDLGLTLTSQQWVVNAYTLTFAGFLMLGGRAADLFGRRRVFLAGLSLFVNVPIGLVMLITAPRTLSESQAPGERERLDVEGAFLITAGLAVFVYGIIGTDTHAWGSTQAVIALAGGIAFLAAAIAVEARVAVNPLVPLSVFRRRSLCAANGIAMAVGAALFAMYFFVSLYLQEVVGDTPCAPAWRSCPPER